MKVMVVVLSLHDVAGILNKIARIGDNGAHLKPRSIEPYMTAFRHKSYAVENQLESNERLEYLGDSFVGSITAAYLVRRFPVEQEGFLTKIRTRIVRSSMLFRFAIFLDFGKYMLLGSQIEKLTVLGSNKGRNNPRLYEDCFEAFIGAIIDDFGDEDGFRYAKRFFIAVMEHIIDFSDLVSYNENFKDTLQRYFQSRKWDNPVYTDIAEFGPSHLKQFVKGVFLKQDYYNELPDSIKLVVDSYQHQIKYHGTFAGLIIGQGTAARKNVAEQRASSVALANLNIDPQF